MMPKIHVKVNMNPLHTINTYRIIKGLVFGGCFKYQVILSDEAIVTALCSVQISETHFSDIDW